MDGEDSRRKGASLLIGRRGLTRIWGAIFHTILLAAHAAVLVRPDYLLGVAAAWEFRRWNSP